MTPAKTLTPIRCHCGKMARYDPTTGAWRCIECRCHIRSREVVIFARCDTGLDIVEGPTDETRVPF